MSDIIKPCPSGGAFYILMLIINELGGIMITRRQEIFKFGQFDTVQVFFHCDWCKEETNAVKWSIKIVPKTGNVYTCPICSVKHITIKERL